MSLKTSIKDLSNKESIRFVAVLFACYLLFSQGNIFMNSVMSPGGRFYNQFVAEHLNYIQWLRTALIVPATWVIKLFGYYVIHDNIEVLIAGGPLVRVQYSCLGLGILSFLAAFIIAFPAKLPDKFKMLIRGFIVVYLLNVLRIIGLGVLMAIFKSQRQYFNYHHEIFNILLYIVVFFMLYKWIKKQAIEA